MTLAYWLFWISAGLLLHHHVLFPATLWLIAKLVPSRRPLVLNQDELPAISVLVAVHNEEKVLEEKIRSTFDTDYPIDRLEVLVGSDASTDRTNDLLQQMAIKYPRLRWWHLPQRSGKAAVMNFLASQASGSVLVLTDANVMFTPSTLRCLVQPLCDESIGLVGGTIVSQASAGSQIARQESLYQRYENALKYYEGKVWGLMMGAFGGCYAVRRSLFEPVPPAVIIDDFFITLTVLRKGKKAIAELTAVCYETVGHSAAEEFRRKSRIATGNFQIFWRYAYLLMPRYGALAYVFFSHKVLRWFAPHLMVVLYCSSFVLAAGSLFYQWVTALVTLAFLTPAIVWLADKAGFSWEALRYVSHYIMMNAAMLNGFFQYVKGAQHHVWQPTQRTG
ncbi:MAG: glycosyltransferase family 2 protein [Chitinophagales bacterium]|nr:glycosyltransferase family 2 protein [Chitinophagales bacterium]MDW8427489.1 glycosyltransferase family 2 protein [Chitinophagales bacterium]